MPRYLTGLALGVMLIALGDVTAVAQQCCPSEQCPGDLQCDNTVDISELITIVNAALYGCATVESPTPAPTQPLTEPPTPEPSAIPTGTPGPRPQGFPATGQTTCWDAAGTAILCGGTRQDGDVRAGGALAFLDNADGTVTDLNTGLMWEKKSADGSIHDRGNAYSWSDAISTFIAGLNAGGGFAGHSDWRLPNAKELQSIVSHDRIEPVLGTPFNDNCLPGCANTSCSCVQSAFAGGVAPQYWSSTSSAATPDQAWVANTLSGVIVADSKTDVAYVRAVRGGTPGGVSQRFPATGQTTCWNAAGTVIACENTGQDGDARAGVALAYVDNGDGTITDLTTQLMWEKKSADGTMHDWSNPHNWTDALAFIASLNAGGGFAGHTDWRLPNVKELHTLIDYEASDPAVAPIFNNGCAVGCDVLTCSCTRSPQQGTGFHPDYWSATSYIPGPLLGWRVDFSNGAVITDGKEDRHLVRAVRGGL